MLAGSERVVKPVQIAYRIIVKRIEEGHRPVEHVFGMTVELHCTH